MAFKFVVFFAAVAAASAGHLGLYNTHHHGASPLLVSSGHLGQYAAHHDDYHHAPANYKFSYGVKDGHTGDIKEQEETRNGDHVQGHYSVVEADGTRRVVHYQDVGHGFEAQVTREGHAHHEQAHHGHNAVYAHAAPVHHVAVHAAPVHHSAAIHHVAAPVHHVALHAAPVHHSAAIHHIAAPVHHSAAIHHIAAPVHHGYASTYGHGHGHHASSYQTVNVHQNNHHDSHYGHHY